MQKPIGIDKAVATKYPESVVMVTTRAKDGHPNVMAVGWVAIASGDPLMFMLGIDGDAHTYKLIKQTREFVVAFPHERMGKATLHVGTCHGAAGRDKLAEAGLKAQKAAKVKAPLLADAVANFECKLVEITQPGDCPLLIGRVVAAHVNRRAGLKRLYTVAQGHNMGGVRTRPGTRIKPGG